MTIRITPSLTDLLHESARPLSGAREDFDPILDLVGDARIVFLGEASHGTHEFYRARAEITKRLIQERGFVAVAAEADWPDAYRVNRYVRAVGSDGDAAQALSGFLRFPQWMWRNADVVDFVTWLRAYNDDVLGNGRKVGFYGLDLYSLHASMAAVLEYLRIVDPEAARRAQYRYACFEQFGEDPQAYGYATSYGLAPSCEDEVIDQLVDLRRSAAHYAQRDGRLAPDDLFFTEQNARVVRNAERYYRAMFGSRVSSWNLRDQHMADTLASLVSFLERSGPGSKLVVWAHNSHVGDARATEVGAGGELTVGQLARQRFGDDVVLLGFTTHHGTVTAASDWDAPAERKIVRPALAGSYESAFHHGPPNFFLDLRTPSAVATALREPRLERAIGVVYQPKTERLSHYFSARLAEQFDGILHYDETRAVDPLERTGQWERGELPETFPTAL